MALKVDKMGDTETVYEKKFEVTNEVSEIKINMYLYRTVMTSSFSFFYSHL